MTLNFIVLTPNRIVWDSEVEEIVLSTNHQSKPKSMQEGPLDLSKFKARQRWLLT